MNEQVSVIIPVHNGARFLREAIESALAQTWSPIGVLVIDDGSTDGTAEVISGFGTRIRSLRQQHLGIGATRNAGLRSASTPFIALLDADDVWLPDKVALQMAHLQAHPATAACVTMAENFFTPGTAVVEHARLAAPVPAFSMSAILARRSLFERMGPLDEAGVTSDSIEWFIRARQRGEVIDLLRHVLVRRRLHDANTSRRKAAVARDELVDTLKHALDLRRGMKSGPKQ